MHRIDGAGHADNLFTEGNPGTATPATTVTAEWCNAVQEEIAHVIEEAEIELLKGDNTQLFAAIMLLIGTSIAEQQRGYNVGDLVWSTGASAPEGTVKANGALLSRLAYADLFNWASENGLVVTEAAWTAGAHGKYSSGNGSTTFRLPDLRGEFIRGWDDGRGVDSGRGLGTAQGDLTKSHNHDYVDSGTAFWMDVVGTAAETIDGVQHGTANAGAVTEGGTHSVVAPHTVSSGGVETRPRNVAFLACIKY